MTRTLAALVLCLAAAQEEPTAAQTLASYESAIKSVPGIIDVGISEMDGRTVIRVLAKTKDARDAVRIMCGEKLGAFPVVIVMGSASSTTSACAHCPVHCGGPGRTVAAAKTVEPKVDTTRLDDPQYAQEKCDILRKWLGLPQLPDTGPRCQNIVSWSNDPAKHKWVVSEGLPHWRSQEMPGVKGSDMAGVPCPDHGKHQAGEILCYTWIKHRQFCPLGTKQILKEVDNMTPAQGSRR